MPRLGVVAAAETTSRISRVSCIPTMSKLTRSLTALRARHQVVGVGITEYVPQLDHDQQVLTKVLGALGLTGRLS